MTKVVHVQQAGIHVLPTSLFIREHLKAVGEDYLYNIWMALKAARDRLGLQTGSRDTFAAYIWYLEKMNLIEFTGKQEPTKRGVDGYYYRIVARNLNRTDAWTNPRAAMYPNSYKKGHPSA